MSNMTKKPQEMTVKELKDITFIEADGVGFEHVENCVQSFTYSTFEDFIDLIAAAALRGSQVEEKVCEKYPELPDEKMLYKVVKLSDKVAELERQATIKKKLIVDLEDGLRHYKAKASSLESALMDRVDKVAELEKKYRRAMITVCAQCSTLDPECAHLDIRSTDEAVEYCPMLDQKHSDDSKWDKDGSAK